MTYGGSLRATHWRVIMPDTAFQAGDNRRNAAAVHRAAYAEQDDEIKARLAPMCAMRSGQPRGTWAASACQRGEGGRRDGWGADSQYARRVRRPNNCTSIYGAKRARGAVCYPRRASRTIYLSTGFQRRTWQRSGWRCCAVCLACSYLRRLGLRLVSDLPGYGSKIKIIEVSKVRYRYFSRRCWWWACRGGRGGPYTQHLA